MVSKETKGNAVKAIIETLRKLNVQIFVEGKNLKINVRKGGIDDQLKLLITSHKESLIEYINQTIKDNVSEITSLPIQSDYLLSSSQYWFWILSQVEEVNIAYNMMGIFEFAGALNFTSLEYAFQKLIERHEILRTTFRENEQGQIRQCIRPVEDVNFRISFLDLQQDDKQEMKVKNSIELNYKQPFDLSLGPLLRVNLYQLEKNKWVFSYMMHHIITDAWSMEILIKEVLLLYNSHNNGKPHDLQPLRIQYKDYAYWQQMQLKNGFYDKHKDFWLRQLDGVLPVLNLSTDRPRKNFKTYNGDKIDRKISRTLVSKLHELSLEHECTLFMSLLTTVTILLYKYTNQEDIILGTPVSGRDSVDLEAQIGLYLNALPLRTQFKKEHSFNELLENIKHVTLNAYEHQMFPFHLLVDSLDLQRDMSRNPIYDVLIIMTNAEINNIIKVESTDPLKIKPYKGLEHKISKLDLTFAFVEMEDDLHVGIEYNTDLFDKLTIVKICNNLEKLIESIICEPSVPIQQLEHLGIEDKLKELENLNNVRVDFPDDKTILELIELKAIQNADSIAFNSDGTVVTYNEINVRANRLCNYIQNRFKKDKDHPIGIQLEDKTWLLITALAIMKMRKTFILIDPMGSQEYLNFVLKDSKCKLVIDKQEVDVFSKEQMNYDERNPLASKQPEDAFSIYDNRNKQMSNRLIVNRRSLVNYIAWNLDEYSEDPNSSFFTLLTETHEVLIDRLYNRVISYNRSHVLSNVGLERSFSHSISDDF